MKKSEILEIYEAEVKEMLKAWEDVSKVLKMVAIVGTYIKIKGLEDDFEKFTKWVEKEANIKF